MDETTSPNDGAPDAVLARTLAAGRQPDVNRGIFDAPHAVLVGLIVGYAIMDFLLPILFANAGPSSVFPAFLAGGAVLGQIAFLAIWASLGPFRLGVRWPAVLLTSVGLYFSLCLGILSTSNGLYPDFREMATPTLFFPLLFLILQIPLWIRRSISGWRIVANEEAAQSSAIEARQFSLMHILALMAYLAVALSLARVAITYMSPPLEGVPQLQLHVWLGLVFYGGVMLLYVAVWAGPCLRACFFAREKGTGCVVIVVVWFGVSMLLIVLIATISTIAGGGEMPGEAIACIFGTFGGTVAVLIGSLHLLRVAGYTMIRTGPDPNAPRDKGESPFARQTYVSEWPSAPQINESDCPFAQQPPQRLDSSHGDESD
ncbi:MAG: hypothetical protein GX621_04530 [Pirellulaceae bacterium]|nr:hypothetical protein [Pirellulaceae bacterium]